MIPSSKNQYADTMIDVTGLKGIPETLLIPLMGRALETKKENGILVDPKSLKIFEQLDYDFSKFSDRQSQRSLLRTTVRTVIIDRWLGDFLKKEPGTTVVELGCGLNTRFERMDNGKLQWFDLDLPEVYKIWQTFFDTSSRRSFLPYSVFNEEWIHRVLEKSRGPYLLIAEASVIYFSGSQVRKLFKRIHRLLPSCQLIFDFASQAFIENLTESGDALRQCSANIQWSIDDIATINRWVPGAEIIRTLDLERPPEEVRDLYPDDYQPDSEGYQLNWVRV